MAGGSKLHKANHVKKTSGSKHGNGQCPEPMKGEEKTRNAPDEVVGEKGKGKKRQKVADGKAHKEKVEKAKSILERSEEKKAAANAAFAKGDHMLAVALYTAAIEYTPKNHLLFSNRSVTYQMLNQLDEAMNDARRCIALDATFYKGYFRLAVAAFNHKDYDTARSAASEGLTKKCDPQVESKLEDIRDDCTVRIMEREEAAGKGKGKNGALGLVHSVPAMYTEKSEEYRARVLAKTPKRGIIKPRKGMMLLQGTNGSVFSRRSMKEKKKRNARNDFEKKELKIQAQKAQDEIDYPAGEGEDDGI